MKQIWNSSPPYKRIKSPLTCTAYTKKRAHIYSQGEVHASTRDTRLRRHHFKVHRRDEFASRQMYHAFSRVIQLLYGNAVSVNPVAIVRVKAVVPFVMYLRLFSLSSP
ncbi:hypothetical protein OCU04_005990 [Sclerotinia nivalis]|uniref:Uncharacterized protein n=1 Tax=Sclerotinia nivalis TaxID=352851 RepID=A0A9X0DK38_9HELO|nr:hypothetical protein OCU04_005990 [Sclerotinia nivalis]